MRLTHFAGHHGVGGLTPEEIVLGTCADLCWTVCYLLAIRACWKDKRYGFPMAAIATMWSFEFLFSFVWPMQQPLWRVVELVWFVLDTVLMVQTFRYARATITADRFRAGGPAPPHSKPPPWRPGRPTWTRPSASSPGSSASMSPRVWAGSCRSTDGSRCSSPWSVSPVRRPKPREC